MCWKITYLNIKIYVLVDFNLWAFTSKIRHSDPEISKSTTYAIISCFLENRLDIHGKFDPFPGCFSSRYSC